MESTVSLHSSTHHFVTLDVMLESEKLLKPHEFYCCTLDHFAVEGDRAFAKISLDWEREQLTITKSISSETGSVPLEHAPKCPMRFLAPDSNCRSAQDMKVRVGICVLVQDKNGKILISRRSPNLRTCKFD